MALAAAIIAGVISVGTIAYGAVKQGQAKRAAKNNKRPTYHTPQAELDNLDQLEYMSGQGLSDQTKQYYTQNADRGLTYSIDSILKGGGDVNAVDKTYQRYLDNMGAISVADDEAKLKNLYSLLGERSRIAEYQDKEFMYNQHGPFADKAQMIAQEKAYGDQLVMQGISSLGSAAAGYAGSRQGMQKTTKPVGSSVSSGGAAGGAAGGAIGVGGSTTGLNFQNYSNNATAGGGFQQGNYLGAGKTYWDGYNSDSYTPYQKMIIANLLNNS